MDCVLATKELDALAESEKAQEPAHEVLWSAGGYKSAHGREEHGVKRIVEPGIVDVSVWLSEVRDQEKEAQRRQHHGECPQRPSEPCGGDAGAHPTQSSLPFLCPFCHNTTLQHYRLPSVTATVTNEKIQGELRRIPILGTSVYRATQAQWRCPDSRMTALFFLSFRAGSGCNHKETWAGCIVSLTTPTRSSLRASRSVSSLSAAEKASRVLAASYFLL